MPSVEMEGSTKTRNLRISLAKQTRGVTFKRRAPRAIKEIRRIITRHFKPDTLILDGTVNHFVWSKGIRNIPRKIDLEVETTEKQEDDKVSRVVVVRLVDPNAQQE